MASDQSSDPLSGIRIVALTRARDRGSFDCGVDSLNIFLKTVAREQASAGKSTTYVATYDQKTIAAYYTIVPGAKVDVGGVSVRCVLLGKLAVDKRYMGRRIGTYLLMNVAYDSQIIAETDNSVLLTVDALKETGSPEFYAKFGFAPLEADQTEKTVPMYMTLEYIRALALEFSQR